MKKLFLVILILLVLGWVFCSHYKNEIETKAEESFSKEEKDLKSKMDTAKLLTYVDKTYNVRVPYPSFFEVSNTGEVGTIRFCYPNIIERKITLTMFVEPNVEGWSIKDAVENLTDSITRCIDSNESYFIIFGKGKERNSGYYVEKCYLIDNRWVDYTLYYKPEFNEKGGIEKLMKMVMKWKPFKDEKCDTLNKDSFTIIYSQPVNDYKVKAVAKLAVSDVDIISADLTFTKGGQSFTLHTQCFGDTVFCKGRLDKESENPEMFRKYKDKTIEADYHKYMKEDCLMPMYTPFFFMDLDFDGVEELVIVHHSMAVRYHDGYDVYRIVEGRPVLIDYPPYNDNKEDWGFGMTDYPEFDFKKKMISCPYPEGPGGLGYEGRVIYGVSKKQKDTIVVNERKHYYNHIEQKDNRKYDKISSR